MATLVAVPIPPLVCTGGLKRCRTKVGRESTHRADRPFWSEPILIGKTLFLLPTHAPLRIGTRAYGHLNSPAIGRGSACKSNIRIEISYTCLASTLSSLATHRESPLLGPSLPCPPSRGRPPRDRLLLRLRLRWRRCCVHEGSCGLAGFPPSLGPSAQRNSARAQPKRSPRRVLERS